MNGILCNEDSISPFVSTKGKPKFPYSNRSLNHLKGSQTKAGKKCESPEEITKKGSIMKQYKKNTWLDNGHDWFLFFESTHFIISFSLCNEFNVQ